MKNNECMFNCLKTIRIILLNHACRTYSYMYEEMMYMHHTHVMASHLLHNTKIWHFSEGGIKHRANNLCTLQPDGNVPYIKHSNAATQS